ncbi:hypothetical protein GCM10023197_04870 [Gordonia humi]
MLRGALVLPAALAVGAAATACGPTTDEARDLADMLVPHVEAALRQQRAAESLAPRLTEYTAALEVIAAQRKEHATALRDEIDRVHSSSAEQIAVPAENRLSTVDALREALTASARSAGADAVAHTEFVAGLLASVSASCTTLAEVQLA